MLANLRQNILEPAFGIGHFIFPFWAMSAPIHH